MTAKNTRLVIRWPSAAILIAGIAAVSAVYVLVDDPEVRGNIGIGVAAVFALILAFARRILGVVALVALIAIPIPSCTPQQTLTALELARKLGDAVCSLCPEESP